MRLDIAGVAFVRLDVASVATVRLDVTNVAFVRLDVTSVAFVRLDVTKLAFVWLDVVAPVMGAMSVWLSPSEQSSDMRSWSSDMTMLAVDLREAGAK